MSKLILGDNPFFAISHLSPEKSNAYLQDPSRFKNAASIINRVSEIEIDLMMISSHADTKDLLNIAGYPSKTKLPDICLVVPNVHDLNAKAARNGLGGALSPTKMIKSLVRSLNVRRTLRRLIVNDIDYPQVKYVALHNVVVDMLLGMRAGSVLKLFSLVCRISGYKPVFLTLNPTKLLSLKLKAHAICTYYNCLGYNMTTPASKTFHAFNAQDTISEIWAMGIMASGAVSIEKLEHDPYLKDFSKIIIASSKFERLEALKDVMHHD